jgi:hypothetical protein
MHPVAFVRTRAAVLGLFALAAAAPEAQAQRQPRVQVEASVDHTGSEFMHGVIADGPAGSAELKQKEAVRYSVGASGLARVAPRTSLRLGLLLTNKGFDERSTISSPTGTRTTERHVDLLYLGAPITLGYNVINPRRGLKPFAEAGVLPELLVRQDESDFGLDLRDTGLSYLFNVGVKYNLGDGRAVMLAPELRYAAREYSRKNPATVDFRPITTSLKLGFQF